MNKMNKILYILVLAIFTIPVNSLAITYKVIAVVNGESISNVQLKDRVDIIMNSTGMRKTKANKKKVALEAYDILINEALQSSEAKSKGVGLSESQMKEAVNDLEHRNHIPPGGFKKFIKSKGLSYQATLDQIKAGLLWKKTVASIFRTNIEVPEEEIDAKAKEYSSKDIKRRVRISEIVIPIEYDAEDETYAKAMEVSRRANAGEDFKKLAKEFSAGKTASAGGKIGWMEESLIMPPLDEEVARLKAGQVGEPIRVDEMYVIIKLDERKVINPAKNREALREKVLVEKLETRAKKYVKGLRQKAYIEKRYKGNELLKVIQ